MFVLRRCHPRGDRTTARFAGIISKSYRCGARPIAGRAQRANLVPHEPDRNRDSQRGTGVQELRIKHIVVLGRAICEGIRAFADYGPLRAGGWRALPTPLFREGGV